MIVKRTFISAIKKTRYFSRDYAIFIPSKRACAHELPEEYCFLFRDENVERILLPREKSIQIISGRKWQAVPRTPFFSFQQQHHYCLQQTMGVSSSSLVYLSKKKMMLSFIIHHCLLVAVLPVIQTEDYTLWLPLHHSILITPAPILILINLTHIPIYYSNISSSYK